MTIIATRAIRAHHDQDPKQEILKKLPKEIDQIELYGAQVLLATYIAPEKTASGIYLTEKGRQESVYQGKVGLVIKFGPLAFEEDLEKGLKFPKKPKEHDWVVVRVGDTFPFLMDGVACRIVDDTQIRMSIPVPDIAY